MENCFLCKREVPEIHFNIGGPLPVNCSVCGSYTITEGAAMELQTRYTYCKPVWSWATRMNSELGTPLTIHHVADLETLLSPTQGLLGCIDQLLLHLNHRHTQESPAKYVVLNPGTDFPLAFCRDAEHFEYVVEKAVELKFIAHSPEAVPLPVKTQWGYSNAILGQYRLDVEGWRRLQNLEPVQREPALAFIAMSFSEEMRPLFDASISVALKATGYDGLRIDQREFNGEIADRIISEIRKSRFIIADLTEHRHGVYFEAGFALGLGLPVVWTCRKDQMHERHFDVSHFNCIAWESYEDLSRRLIARIEATLPLPIHPKRNSLLP